MANCNNRFDMTINNKKIFPTVVPCLEQQPLEYKRIREDGSDWDAADALSEAAGQGPAPWGTSSTTEPWDKEGKWLIDDKNYHLVGGPSSQTFLRRYVRKLCPTTLRQFVVGKWVPPKNPIFRDIGMPMKKGPLFSNTTNNMTKNKQYAKYATGRYNR
tara:strand:+ start:3298 stop:3771 length:474 start_codon:yes stop_codon:yes gene_type:complete